MLLEKRVIEGLPVLGFPGANMPVMREQYVLSFVCMWSFVDISSAE